MFLFKLNCTLLLLARFAFSNNNELNTNISSTIQSGTGTLAGILPLLESQIINEFDSQRESASHLPIQSESADMYFGDNDRLDKEKKKPFNRSFDAIETFISEELASLQEETQTPSIMSIGSEINCFIFKWSEIPNAQNHEKYPVCPSEPLNLMSKTSSEISNIFKYKFYWFKEYTVEIPFPEIFSEISGTSEKYYEDQKKTILGEIKKLKRLVDTTNKYLPRKYGVTYGGRNLKVNIKKVVINIITRQLNNLELSYYLITLHELLKVHHPLVDNGTSFILENLIPFSKKLSELELKIGFYTFDNFYYLNKLVYTQLTNNRKGKLLFCKYIVNIRSNFNSAIFILENRRHLKLDRENISDNVILKRIEDRLGKNSDTASIEEFFGVAEGYKGFDSVISNIGENKYGGDVDCLKSGENHKMILDLNVIITEFEQEHERQMNERLNDTRTIMKKVINIFYKNEIEQDSIVIRGLLDFIIVR